ncbi:MAG: helix-turn-helix transcriptional regulator [Bacillales bacterium]|nr:helix-turn-helix transcriptional regulator [Bacillales bacterium]
MNITSLTRIIKKTKINEAEKQKNLTIGALAKRKRLNLGLTQSEVAKSICSISYLSKIESNKINPNPRCLELLMEKVKIPKWEIYVLENAPELLQNSIDFFYDIDLDAYRSLYKDVEEIEDNHTADIIKLGYYVMNKDKDSAKNLIERDLSLVNSMDRDMIKIFALYCGEYFLMVSDFETALSIATVLSDTRKTEKKLSVLIDDFCFRLYYKTKRPAQAANLFNELLLVYSSSIHIPRLKTLKMEYARLLFLEKEYQYAIDMCESIKNLIKSEDEDVYNAIVGASYYMLKKEITAKEYLDKINIYSPLFSNVVFYKYCLEEEKESYIKNVKKLNESNPNFYLEYFYRKEENTVSRELFENESFTKLFEGKNVYQIVELYNLEREYLMSISKYKDSCLLANKIKELLDNQTN